MDFIVIIKEKLLDRMKANRNNHILDYNEALEGWKESVVEELKDALENANLDIEYKIRFNLPEPISHKEDYDRIIDQVIWSNESEIKLSATDFEQFIRDNWVWKEGFATTNAFYINSKKV